MYNNAYIVPHPQSQLALGDVSEAQVISGADLTKVEKTTPGGDAESTDTGVNDVAVPTASSDDAATTDISDDVDYKDHYAHLLDYAANYRKRALFTEGCIVESRTHNPTVVKSWKVVAMKGKSTCVLQSVNNLSLRHGKYKISNPPGNQVEMDIGYLKFMLSKADQDNKEAGTEVNKANKSRWFGDELETNPYIV